MCASLLLAGCSSGDNGPATIVLKPVDANGNTAAGWSTDTSREDAPPVDCAFGTPSPYDVNDGVRYCSPTADSADACWPTANDTKVLCLVDPFAKVVTLLSAEELATPRKPLGHDPIPIGLVLDDGTKCRARNGGSWPSPKEQPDWVGYYSCTGPGFLAIWGPSTGGGGIARSSDGWTVMEGPEDGHLVKHKVTKAYYVGVASRLGP